tara:strand:+ start:413 stop:736 length:324 start_codon:yes stop_codon:yes gene_type:complete
VPQNLSLPVSGTMMGYYPATSASTALALSIIGLASGVMCFPLCGLLAVPGLIMGHTAVGVTKSTPGHPDTSAAKAAQVIGLITVGLLLLFFLVISAVIALEVSSGTF